MRALASPLSERQFQRRFDSLTDILEQYGEVSGIRRGRDSRQLVLLVALPGYDLPLEATMILVEQFRRRREGWRRISYRYEYLVEPRPSSRRAHHWHDESFHIHCVDRENPKPYRHYRGFPMDSLEAAREFAEIHERGRVDCFGLHPLE